MIVERLPFEDPAVKYHSYHAAQHVVRYASVKDIVAGKRVLDIASGEGYGAKLLLDWGARSVTGVEISSAAVATAKRLFGGKNIKFLVGDAENLEPTLKGVQPFDLIVSFETIEHLANPERFLAYLPKCLAADGAIVMSCPNDSAYSDAHDNRFHMHRYSLEEFRTLSESHLGEASMWLLGTPLLGEMHYLPGDDFVENEHDAQLSLTKLKKVDNAVCLPVQSNLVTTNLSCSHYIGVWGTKITPNAAISSLSVASFQEPWKAIDFLKKRIAEHEKKKTEYYEPQLESQQAEITRLKAHIEQERGAVSAELAHAQQLVREYEKLKTDWYEPQLESRRVEIHRLRAHIEQETGAVAAELAQARQALAEHEKRRADWYEPELERQQAEINRLKMQKEQETGAIAAELAQVRQALAEQEKRKAEWYEPELERLQAQTGELKLEQETFTAQTQQQIAGLHARIERQRSEITRAAEDADAMRQQLAKLRIESKDAVREAGEAVSKYETLQEKVTEQLEPQIARMKSHIEHARFEKETQVLRSRLMGYAKREQEARERIAALEGEIRELHNVQTSWFVPEISRLNEVIATFEKTKSEWWDPQLEMREARIILIEAELQALRSQLNHG